MKSKESKKSIGMIITLLPFLIFSFCLLSTHAFADFPLKEGSFAPTGKKTYQYVPGEIIVKFKDVATERQIDLINSMYETSVVYTSPYARFKRIKIPPDKTVFEMVELYRKNPLVEYAEPNYIVYTCWIPNDPYYSYQWHLTQINMPSAWDIEQGGNSSVIVAVLDTGVAYEDYGPYQQAPDLAGTNFVSGYDFVNNDFHPNDDRGHGTHVTGTIAQTTNNNLGVAGIAFNCSIIPVKVLDAEGLGTHQQIADGIYYAVNNGAKIINLSLGGSSGSTTLYNAVKYAYDHGVIIVAAAGNDNEPSISYPAAYDECIAVGAVRYDKTRAPYSNYGNGIELMAPGGDTSLDQNGDGYADGVLQQTFSGDPTNFSYWFWQGTSMATPHVTGIVALMLSHGASGIENIRNILHLTAEDLGDSGYDNEYGYGLVDAAAALTYTEYPDLTITVISYSSAHPNEPVDFYVTIANQGTQDVTEDFYVDIYYDPSETPVKGETSRKEKGQIGDDWQLITQIIPAGESIQISFTHTFTTLGEHEIWAQVDTDDYIAEANEDNNIYGPESVRVVVPPGDGTLTYWAVIAGVSDYLYINDLNFCDEDAQEMYNTLVADPNWSSSNIHLLIDNQATKSGIYSAINNVLYGGFDQDDVFLFYFSGHGTHYYDEPPIDEIDGYDEYICPYDMNGSDLSTAIRDDELEEWLNAGIKGAVILDTCHSGGFVKYDDFVAKCILLPGVPKAVIIKGDGFTKDLEILDNMVVLTACDDDETSLEDPYLQHGVFTYYVLEALNATSTDLNSNNKISIEEIFNYASPKTTDFNPHQHPQISDNYSGELNLVNTPFADLLITSITSSPNPSLPGQEIQVTLYFTNQGNADAGIFCIDLYKNRDTAPSGGELGDMFVQIPGLTAKSSSYCIFTYSYNTDGIKKIWAQIDTDDFVDESNENNNIYGSYDHDVLDTTPPSSVTNFVISQGENNGEINLSWTDPEDSDLQGILVVRNTTGDFISPTDGLSYPDGSGPGGDWCKNILPGTQGFTDVGLDVNTTYYYKAYSYDEVFNYSSGATSTPEGIKPKDNLPPSVTITTPLSEDIISGTVQITASASDNTGVIRVDFWCNSTLISSDTTSPYSISWDTTALSDGWWYLTATAYDTGDLSNSDHIWVKVDNTAPLASIVSPSPHQFVSGVVNITGTAWDSNFKEYRIEYGAGESPTDWCTVANPTTPVISGNLSSWDTASVADGEYTLRLSVDDFAGNISQDTVIVNVNNLPPLIIHNPIASATYNEPVSVTAAISSECSISTARVYFRKGGEITYTSAPMSSGSDYHATIPSTYITERGLEYYIEAEDIFGNTATSPEENASVSPYIVRVNFSSLSFPFTTLKKKWQMISVPAEIDNPSPDSVLVDDLGTQDDTKWKLYRWNTANGSYDEYPSVPDFTPGKAFWLITKNPQNIDVDEGKSVDTSSDYAIDLASGWTQIGCPFAFNVDLNDVKVKKDSEIVSIQEAAQRDWLRDIIWYWDGDEYVFYQAPSGIIQPWKGYWVKALAPCTLLIPTLEAGEVETTSTSRRNIEKFLQIIARVEDLKDSHNFIGFSGEAKDTYDRLDIDEAPPVSPYISLSFYHEDWGKNSGLYTQDIRKTPDGKSYSEKITWLMQIKTDRIGKTCTLEWKNTQAIPKSYNLYLLSEKDEVIANMRKVFSYSFIILTGEEKFKIVATKENLLSEKLTLQDVGNYPNPVHSEFTTIRFKLGKEAKVTIKIYTISGELVRTLVQDEAFSQGLNDDVTWDLRNDAGERVARGVYILLIKARASEEVLTKTGKIALIK